MQCAQGFHKITKWAVDGRNRSGYRHHNKASVHRSAVRNRQVATEFGLHWKAWRQ
jgi:hypothetical protein